MVVPVKQGDLYPDVETTVQDEANANVDLTGATVKFSMRSSRNPSVAALSLVTATIVDAPTGKISYQWAAGNTDTPGTYEGEFRVTPAAGDPFRVPTEGYIAINIEPKAG